MLAVLTVAVVPFIKTLVGVSVPVLSLKVTVTLVNETGLPLASKAETVKLKVLSASGVAGVGLDTVKWSSAPALTENELEVPVLPDPSFTEIVLEPLPMLR